MINEMKMQKRGLGMLRFGLFPDRRHGCTQKPEMLPLIQHFIQLDGHRYIKTETHTLTVQTGPQHRTRDETVEPWRRWTETEVDSSERGKPGWCVRACRSDTHAVRWHHRMESARHIYTPV